MSLSHKIQQFLAQENPDFESGLYLLSQVMSNVYFLQTIRRKGPRFGMATLKYELTKRLQKLTPNIELPVTNVTGETSSCLVIPLTGNLADLPENKKTIERQGKIEFNLRKRFPFLSSQDCPQELKILVNDMITSHEMTLDLHEKLYWMQGKSGEKCFEVVRPLVENYLNNRQIWQEMDYYQFHGKILGNHPVFEELKREEEISNLSPEDLLTLYRLLPRRLAHAKKQVEDMRLLEDARADICQKLERIEKMETELRYVRRLLNVPQKPALRKKKTKKKLKTQKR